MFDLSLAQVVHPDRERDLAADLDARRLLKDAATTPLTPPFKATPDRAARTPAARVTTAGR